MKEEIVVGKERKQDEKETIDVHLIEYLVLLLTNSILKIFGILDPEPYYDFKVRPHEEKKIRLFFFKAFYTRSKFYILIFSLLAILFIFTNFGNLQVYGLFLDLIGAITLSVGLFRGLDGINRDTDIHSTGATFGGDRWLNKESLSAVAAKTVDGIYGAAFLSIGFTLQILSTI